MKAAVNSPQQAVLSALIACKYILLQLQDFLLLLWFLMLWEPYDPYGILEDLLPEMLLHCGPWIARKKGETNMEEKRKIYPVSSQTSLRDRLIFQEAKHLLAWKLIYSLLIIWSFIPSITTKRTNIKSLQKNKSKKTPPKNKKNQLHNHIWRETKEQLGKMRTWSYHTTAFWLCYRWGKTRCMNLWVTKFSNKQSTLVISLLLKNTYWTVWIRLKPHKTEFIIY